MLAIQPQDDTGYDSDAASDTSEPESPWLNDTDCTDDAVLFDADKGALFKMKAYVVHGTLAALALVTYNHRITIDTGVGPNLLRYDLLPQEWREEIEPHPDPQMCGASGRRLAFHGVLPLNITIRDSCSRVYFGVVDDLPCG